MEHKGKDCIRIDFAYDSEILKIIRDSKIAMWSRLNICWYIINEKNNLKVLSKNLEKAGNVKYIPFGQKADIIRINDHKTFMSDPFSEYSSLFISYSFKDKKFVNKLNDSLCEKGVNTFLWEKDAPIGETLKDIMFENVHKYDRVLFVASENSLKSSACHYELTQAREKQDKLWKTVLFPIHIDKFLFTVRKENIRPKNMADEYWNNICELRDINSLDFTDISANIDKDKFDKKIKTLLRDLKNN